MLGNVTEFQRAVKLVIDTVSFDKDSTVQVFEANIRYICCHTKYKLPVATELYPHGVDM